MDDQALYLTHLSRIEDKLDDLQRGVNEIRLELARDYLTKAEYERDKDAAKAAADALLAEAKAEHSKRSNKRLAAAGAGGGMVATLIAAAIEVLGNGGGLW
jgi:hypothetical protein